MPKKTFHLWTEGDLDAMPPARIVALFLCLLLAEPACLAQAVHSSPTSAPVPPYRADQILIQPKPGVDLAALAAFHSAQSGIVVRTFQEFGRIQIVLVPTGEAVPDFIVAYQNSGLVEFAEPDYFGEVFNTLPNDPKFLDGTLWGLNTIQAPAGWDVLTSASNIVVAVLDTGVRYTHEDLAANMWVNTADGSHGWNELAGTDDPSDDNGHGTLVAGVLGAVGNNGKGVTGVAWQVQIMAVKCFNQFGIGSISSVVAGMEYAETNGARIINASWGFTNSLALSNAVYGLQASNLIVVAASGNNTNDIDLNPNYPAGYHFDNVVTVAATSTNDALSAYSNYGGTNVQLAAPGDQVYSTFAASDSFYYTESGTSFSAPYVTGALALMLAKYPTDTYQQIIRRVLNATDPVPSLSGKCSTGGRLNLRKALNPPIILNVVPGSANGAVELNVSSGPNRLCVVEVSADLANWSPIFTNTTSNDGTLSFTDVPSTNSIRRFYRAASTL